MRDQDSYLYRVKLRPKNSVIQKRRNWNKNHGIYAKKCVIDI
jgi:hypothetical protein